MRVTTVAVALCLSVLGLAASPNVDASIRKPTNIPAQALGTALRALEKERNLQVIFVSEDVRNVITQGAVGEFTSDEAMKQLLKGTGLTFRYLDEKTVTIVPLNSAPASDTSGAGPVTPSVQPPSSTDGNTKTEEGKKGFLDRFRLAQVDQGISSSSTSVKKTTDQSSQSKPEKLEEVVVSAQKKSENLQDVPIPVTAISAETLVADNQLRIQDYYTRVPGLNVTPGASGSYQSLTIRGITTGVVENPTVGVTVDDVPYGTSTSNGGGGAGQIVPDIDPGDLARVEVLRGPQGTLYGASSMGGLLKFVTLDPSTDGVSGRVEADASSVYNGANLGTGVRGSVNVPLSDTFAVRASAFGREDPGYIDNVETGERGVNRATADGGRLSALWRPSEALSLKLSALYQDIRGDGEPDVDKPINGYVGPVLGDLQQYHIRGSGDYERSVQAYSATLTDKLGIAELTAISGYNIESFSDSFDNGYLVTPVSQSFFGVTGAYSPETNSTRKFTQEIRFSIPFGRKFDWLVGAFYTDENSKYDQHILAAYPTGVVAGLDLQDAYAATYMELAGFTDLTIHLTDQFDIQLGARESQIRQTFSDFFTGAAVPGYFPGEQSPYFQPQIDSKADAFTYLVTPEFKLTSDLMVYARFASGYRPGGSNYAAGVGIPAEYTPDKTQNYEIGLKAAFLDHRLSVDASAYYINWDDIQVVETNPFNGFQYTANGNKAKSEGLELSIESRPLTGLSIGGWITVSDATLTQPFPPNTVAYGVSGDRLPYSSRFSANMTMQQDFPLGNGVNGFVGGTATYVGDREGEFTSSPTRTYFPGYSKIDLRVGTEYASWKASLSLTNATDQRGILGGGLNTFPPFGFVYIQPRTVALTLVKTF